MTNLSQISQDVVLALRGKAVIKKLIIHNDIKKEKSKNYRNSFESFVKYPVLNDIRYLVEARTKKVEIYGSTVLDEKRKMKIILTSNKTAEIRHVTDTIYLDLERFLKSNGFLINREAPSSDSVHKPHQNDS